MNLDQVATAMKEAMKSKDKVRLGVLRALKTALTNASIEKGGLGTPLEDTEATAVIRKQLKQRIDSATQFKQAGRPELAETEEAEIAILETFLPQALSASEMETLVAECITEAGASSKADMGKVMKLAQEKAAGRADGKQLSKLVASSLS